MKKMTAVGKSKVIDFHSHVVDPNLLEVCGAHSVQTGFGLRPFPKRGDTSGKGEIYWRMADPVAHLEYMDRAGVDAAVISCSTVLQNTWWADPQTDAKMTRQINDMIAKWTVSHPSRFIGSFTLPMTDMDLALSELERAVKQLRLSVVNLPASVGGVYLGNSRFDPFWQACSELGVASFIHPHGVTDPWFQNYRMWNSIGQSIEEVKVMTSLIYDGVMDRYPGLKIVIAHGGGYFPHYLGRLDRNVTNYPDSTKNIRGKPSDYLRRFYYDTCVYDPLVMKTLIDRVGADRFVIGSDFPVGERDPAGFVKNIPGITDEAYRLIAGENATKILAR